MSDPMNRFDAARRVTIRFMRSAAAFRSWLEAHHADTRELWVGFHKKDSGKPSITYPESVDEALCFGWIDGVRKNVDETSYTTRFTPRRPKSIWSAVNLRRIQQLIADGRMHASGTKTFEGRDRTKIDRYSFEQPRARLSAAQEKRLKANRAAWTFFQAQPPGYRRIAAWYVISAKKEETRQRRLESLIDRCARGLRLAQFIPARPRSRTAKSSSRRA